MKRPSVGDVARRAGVSTATVSRVINTPERVAEPTRRRVEHAIEALGYVQSATAISFKAQRSRIILVAVANVGNVYYSEIFEGVHHTAEAHGYATIITSPAVTPGMRIVDQLRTGRVDGAAILSGYAFPDEDLELLGRLNRGTPPVVGFAEKRGVLSYPHVFIDNRRAARELTGHLIEAGHRRIGHVTAIPGQPVTEERMAGFHEALCEAGLSAEPGHVWDGNFNKTGGRAAARAFAALREADRPTAVFCANDETAMGFVAELWLHGVAVPRDVSVVGFDDIMLADAYVPALTTMIQPKPEIGTSAMRLLLDVMADPAANAGRVIELGTRLVVRDSVAPPRTPAPARKARRVAPAGG